MIFLIQYYPKTGTRSFYKSYEDSEQTLAQQEMFNLELEDNRLELNSEIVLLQAATEEQIKYTHSRYFGFSIEAAIHQFQSVITALLLVRKESVNEFL